MAQVDDATFMRAVCCVSGLDGEICRPGSSLLQGLADRAGLNGTLEAELARVAEDHEFYQQQLSTLAADPERAISAVLRVAGAGGTLDDADRVSARHLADRLGLDPTRTEVVLQHVRVELGLEAAS